MSRKRKRSKHLQKRIVTPQQKIMAPQLLMQQISHARQQMLQGDFANVITTCEPLLSYFPQRSSLRVEVLALLGLAHGMQQHYQESYNLFTEALTLDPTNAELWYNRGLACRYTTRLGQAVLDFEQAIELLEQNVGELATKFAKELERSRREVQEAMQVNGDDVSLDQYIEREENFMQAMNLMRRSKWQEAEQAFRQIIELGGGLPQYWGNLGVSLIMQTRYEEADSALQRALEIDPEYSLARNNLAKIPDVRRAGGPLGIELRDLSQEQNIKQSVTFYKQSNDNSSPIAHTTIEKIGNTVKGTRTPIGKKPPRYRFFLNPYRDVRFITCPRCGYKSRQRKFTLVIHIDPNYPLTLEKMCRYCYHCDLVIVHQDKLEEQLAAYFSISKPEIIGNVFEVIGTLNRTEWKQVVPDRLSTQEMIEHLHDFKEVVTYQRVHS